MTVTEERARQMLVRRGFLLEWATLGWNVAGIIRAGLAGAPLLGVLFGPG